MAGNTQRNRIKRDLKRQIVKAYILEHPHSTNEDVIKATGVSQRLVSLARQDLRISGVMGPVYNDRVNQHLVVDVDTTKEIMVQGTIDLMRQVHTEMQDTTHEWSVEDQLKLMKRYANDSGQAPQIVIAATAQYNKIKADIGARDALGPGAPQNRKEQVQRASLLMTAMGKSVTTEAYKVAFGKGPDESNTEEAPTNAPEAPEVTGSDTNLPTTNE